MSNCRGIAWWTCVWGIMVVAACGGGGGSGGGGTDTADGETIPAGEASTIEGDAAELAIPAGAFQGAMTVTVSEDAADLSTLTQATPISKAVTVAFSETMLVDSDTALALTIDVAPETIQAALAAGDSLYAMVQVEGDTVAALTSSAPFAAGTKLLATRTAWVPVLGTLDRATGTYQIPLYGTTPTVHAVIVRGHQLTAYVPPIAGANRARAPRQAKEFDRSAIVPLGRDPWVVVCVRDTISDPDTLCNLDDPASVIRQLQTRLTDRSAGLAALGFRQLKIQQVVGSQLVETGLPVAEAGDLAAADLTYNVALFENSFGCGESGSNSCYVPTLGMLLLNEDQATIDPQGTDVVAHELFHAIEAGEAPSLFGDVDRNRWLIEALADAVGHWQITGGDAAQLRGRTSFDEPRDWREPLNSDRGDIEYLTAEFFTLIANGSLAYLPTLLQQLEAAGAQGTVYGQLDQALQATLQMGVADAYLLGVMPWRTFNSVARDFYAQTHLGDLDVVLVGETHGMASASYYVYADAEGNTDNYCLRASIEEDAADQQLALMAFGSVSGGVPLATPNEEVVGAYTLTGEELTIYDTEADLKVVDLDTGREPAAVEEWMLVITRDNTCIEAAPQQECFPRRVTCREATDGIEGVCSLIVERPDSTCGAAIIRCTDDGRCTKPSSGRAVDWSECAPVAPLLADFTNHTIDLGTQDTCGGNYCRPIILCAK